MSRSAVHPVQFGQKPSVAEHGLDERDQSDFRTLSDPVHVGTDIGKHDFVHLIHLQSVREVEVAGILHARFCFVGPLDDADLRIPEMPFNIVSNAFVEALD